MWPRLSPPHEAGRAVGEENILRLPLCNQDREQRDCPRPIGGPSSCMTGGVRQASDLYAHGVSSGVMTQAPCIPDRRCPYEYLASRPWAGAACTSRRTPTEHHTRATASADEQRRQCCPIRRRRYRVRGELRHWPARPPPAIWPRSRRGRECRPTERDGGRRAAGWAGASWPRPLHLAPPSSALTCALGACPLPCYIP